MMHFGLYGMDEFKSLLKDLAKTGVSEKDVKKATREGLKLVQKDARNNLRNRGNIKSRSLYKSIKVTSMKRWERRKHGFMTGMKVGPSYAKAPYAHLIELGTASRFKKNKRGKIVSTGMVSAQPFMRPAFNAQYRNAYNTFAQTFSPLLQKRVNNLVIKHNYRRAA